MAQYNIVWKGRGFYILFIKKSTTGGFYRAVLNDGEVLAPDTYYGGEWGGLWRRLNQRNLTSFTYRMAPAPAPIYKLLCPMDDDAAEYAAYGRCLRADLLSRCAAAWLAFCKDAGLPARACDNKSLDLSLLEPAGDDFFREE